MYSVPSLVIWKVSTGAKALVVFAKDTMPTHATSAAAIRANARAKLGLRRGCTGAPASAAPYEMCTMLLVALGDELG